MRNPEFGQRPYAVCHWDTFDNETLLVAEADTLIEAEGIVAERYKDRLRPEGADRVDIVDCDGRVVRAYSVG